MRVLIMALRLVSSVSNSTPTETRQARVYRDVEFNEYRVKLYINGVWRADADYFTDDKADALQTANVMVEV